LTAVFSGDIISTENPWEVNAEQWTRIIVEVFGTMQETEKQNQLRSPLCKKQEVGTAFLQMPDFF